MRVKKMYSLSEKSKIVKKYLHRDVSRKEFSLLHNIPASTIDTWVKRYSQLKSKSQEFVPVTIEPPKKVISLKTVSVDLPSGTRLSFSGEIELSDIVSFTSQLSRTAI